MFRSARALFILAAHLPICLKYTTMAGSSFIYSAVPGFFAHEKGAEDDPSYRVVRRHTVEKPKH